jgi:hypothetical protein
MELLKVFVGDGSSATTIAAMNQGDLLLVKGSDNSVLTATTAAALTASDEVRIVGKNSKGLVYSTPFSKNDVVKVNYAAGTGVTPKVMTATLADIANDSSTFSKTYSLGVQIKEDLRMGTYNKNTEIIVSATTPTSSYIAGTFNDAAEAAMADITSTMAKGFAANPLTSSGSPYQLVKVERIGSGTITALGQTLTVVTGARQVTAGAAVTIAAGTIISIAGGLYLVETGVTSGTVFTLDTAYQGSSATVASGTSSTTVGTVANVTANTWGFRFTGVTPARSNKFDQYRVTDFVVVYPKGFDAAGQITIATPTALGYGVGTWSQVRDMEERSFSNIYPTVNYREFPFSDYNLNADTIATTTNFNLFTLVHNTPAGYGYNLMQSSMNSFPQVTVAAAPTSSNDGTVGSNDFFGSVLTAWWASDATPTSAQFA